MVSGKKQNVSPAHWHPAVVHEVQASLVSAVLALYFPLSQLVHAAADDAVALNLPAAQAATPEPNPVKPAAARQSSSASEAAGLLVLVGQEVQLSLVSAVLALYFPATQLMQLSDVWAACSLYFPAKQLIHVLDDIYLPATQLMHVSDPCAARSLYFPATQLMQLSDAWAACSLYFPAKQLMHVSDDCAAEPLYLPATQPVHTESPVLALKVPAAQAVGVLPSAPVYPTAAIQATLVVEPTGLLALGGQAVNGPPFGPVYPAAAIQSVLAVEPVPVVPELLGHTVHAAAPVAALKVSAAHAVKLPPSGPE